MHPEHFVSLDGESTPMSFPGELAGKIRFDVARQRLVFSGYMTKAEFDKLHRWNNGTRYRRAIEQLFQISTVEKDAPKPNFHWLWSFLLPAIIGAGLALLMLNLP